MIFLDNNFTRKSEIIYIFNSTTFKCVLYRIKNHKYGLNLNEPHLG